MTVLGKKLTTILNSRKRKRQKVQSNRSNSVKKVPKDFPSFAKLITIQSGDKIIKYNAYPYQVKLDKTFESHHTVIGVKSRQMGWTTYAACKGLHKAILNPAYTAIYISRTQSDASLIAYTVRQMFKSIPECATAENDNLLILRIKGGGTLHFRSPGENATRGIPSVSDIFIDEAAFIDDIELLYGQIKNTQSMVANPHTLIISTPNTVTDWFYQKLTNNTPEILDKINQIRKGNEPPVQVLTDERSGWAKFICHWKAHPLYSQIPDYLQRCAEKEQIPIEMVYRERDLSFENNTLSVFSLRLINQTFTLPSYDRIEDIDRDANYYFGIDTAGVGDDYFVCTVLRQVWDKLELCYMYRNRTNNTLIHLDEVVRLIRHYQPFRVSIETNSTGQNYLDLLRENCPEIDIYGINTNGTSKPTMINRLLYLMESQKLTLVDDKIIRNEFLSFQQVDRKFQAITGKHDDTVMSLAIACMGVNVLEGQ